MSSDLTADLEVSIDANKFEKGSDKIQKGFNEIDKSASQAADNVGDSINDMGDKATKSGNKIKKSADKSAGALNKVEGSAKGAAGGVKDIGLEALGATTAITGFNDALLGMNEKFITIERNSFSLERTELDLVRQAEDLATAFGDGSLSALEYTRSIEDLEFASRDFKIETKELKGEVDALGGEMVSLGINLGSTVLFSVLAFNKVLSTTQKIMIANKAAMLSYRAQSLLMSKTFGILIFNTNKFKIAMIGATLSLKGLATGMKAVVASMGPIGIALTVGITLWAIWESNIGGVQEKMAELWELLKKFIPLFQVLETAVNSLFPQEAHAQVQEYGSSIEELTNQLAAGEITAEEFSEQIQNVSSTTQEGTESLSEYNSTLGLANDSTNSLTKSTTSMGSAMSAVPAWYRSASSSVKQYNKDVNAAAEATKGMMDRLREAQALKKKQDSELNTGTFKDVERKRGKLDQSTFDAILARDSGAASRFTVFGGPGRVLTEGLQRQLADNAARNARKSFIRSAEGKALAKEEKKQKQVFQIQLAGNLGLDISDFHVTGKKTDLGKFTKLSIGPKTKESLALLSGMLREARLSEEDALFMSPGELQARISQTKEGRQLAISNNLDVSQVLSNIDSLGSAEGAARFVNRNTFFGGQSNSLGISSGAIEESLRGADKDKVAGQFSDMLGFLNKDRLSVVRT